MIARSRLIDILLGICALALGVALAYPVRPATLPDPRPRMEVAEAPKNPPTGKDAVPRPSISEIASLFTDHRASPPAARPPAPPSTPERVSWLRFVAFVVGSDGQTVYFFKNDQNGRVLMLSYREPHDGWTLSGVQRNAWVLEHEAHQYLITGKER